MFPQRPILYRFLARRQGFFIVNIPPLGPFIPSDCWFAMRADLIKLPT
jgi:hypothetical protein